MNLTILLFICVSLLLGSCDSDRRKTVAVANQKNIISTSTYGECNSIYQRLVLRNATYNDWEMVYRCKNEDMLSNQINALVKYRDKKNIIDLAKSIWAGNQESNPDFAWDLLLSPYVRLSLAQSLYQIDMENKELYRKYIAEQLNAEQPRIIAAATRSIGVIGGNDDISVLLEYVKMQNLEVAGSAIGAIGIIGTEQSKLALQDILRDKNMNEQKKMIAQQVLNSTIYTK